MKFYFYLLIVLQVIISVSTLISDDLWNKTLQYISEGKVNTFGKNCFIFDEENYTALSINSLEMNLLYDKQRYLYYLYSLRSFLFICKKLDRTIEDVYSIRNNIRDHLKNYGVSIERSVFVLISVETIESILYTGSNIRNYYISDEVSAILNNQIKEDIKDKNYYKALENFLSNIEYFILNNFINISAVREIYNNSYNEPSEFKPRYSHETNHLQTILSIILPILSTLLFVAAIYGCCYCKINKKCCFKYDNNTSTNDYNDDYNNRYRYRDNYNNDDRNTNNSIVVNNSIAGNKSIARNYSIGGNSNNASKVNTPSYGNNSILRASGGAI